MELLSCRLSGDAEATIATRQQLGEGDEYMPHAAAVVDTSFDPELTASLACTSPAVAVAAHAPSLAVDAMARW